MKPNKFAVRLLLHCEKDAIYQWHLKPGCFYRSLPSWERAEVYSREELPGRQVRIGVLFERAFRKVKAVFRIHYPIGGQIIRIIYTSFLREWSILFHGQRFFLKLEGQDLKKGCSDFLITNMK